MARIVAVGNVRIRGAVFFAALIILGVTPTGARDPHPANGITWSAGENFRIRPGPVTQTEPIVFRHPLDHDLLFVAANTFDLSTGFISEGIYTSTDGGSTWSGSDSCSGEPIQFHRGDPGIAIDKDGSMILTRLGFSPGLYSHYSTDMGASWSAQSQVAPNDQDRAEVASDSDTSSATFGRTYASWVRFAPPYPVMIANTTNGGIGWGVPFQINNPSQRSQGAAITIGDGGMVCVCWAGVGSTSPFTEDFIGFARSTDGGAQWTVTENAFDINGIAGTLSQKANIRVNGLPRIAIDNSGGVYDGRIYIVTTEIHLSPAGSDPDIILRFSQDSGATWSSAIRVNRDIPDNGKIQYFPALHVDDGGGVNVLYYSDEPTTPDSAAIYLARSVDGGMTWESLEIGDHRFLPQPIDALGAGYQGDNISLTSSGDTLLPVWTDNSSGIYQLWSSRVSISSLPVSVDDPVGVPAGFTLEQNYPNPFNPSTLIRFSLPREEEVTLSVHDLVGKTVGMLIQGSLPPGDHSAVFSTRGGRLGSGIYIYRLKTSTAVESRKMLLLK